MDCCTAIDPYGIGHWRTASYLDFLTTDEHRDLHRGYDHTRIEPEGPTVHALLPQAFRR